MGAEEVFPDSVALLRWRDRNQRMLPKVALDGISTSDSGEQLIHCLQPGDKDSQLVVYGHGVSQAVKIAPPLLAAWGGDIVGFNISRWVHSASTNQKKMMAVMENVTKLVRSNKFLLETVLYKVGEDATSDAFARAADASDSAQVVLLFPTLQEELQSSFEDQKQEKQKGLLKKQEEETKRKEEAERDKLKTEWLNLLFTDQSVAATSPEGPLPISMESGTASGPTSLIVWVGDNPKSESAVLKDLSSSMGKSRFMAVAWSQHPAGEAMAEMSLSTPEIVDGSWYLRDRSAFENQDLDTLHDCELLGRSLVETIEPKLGEHGLSWKNVIILGFGKGAGIALYASLLNMFPEPISSMMLFSPVILFPSFLSEKLQSMPKSAPAAPMKVFLVWGNRNRSTPGTYRQLLAQVLRKAPQVHCTPDTVPDGENNFDDKYLNILNSLLPLCLPR